MKMYLLNSVDVYVILILYYLKENVMARFQCESVCK